MILKESRRGSATVEAAVLFPLIISLTVGGFALMTHWYSQWENGLEEHQEAMKQLEGEEHLRILHWEQWSGLREDENERE